MTVLKLKKEIGKQAQNQKELEKLLCKKCYRFGF